MINLRAINACGPINDGIACRPPFLYRVIGPTAVVYSWTLTRTGEVVTGVYVCVPAHDNMAKAPKEIEVGPTDTFGGCPCT